MKIHTAAAHMTGSQSLKVPIVSCSACAWSRKQTNNKYAERLLRWKLYLKLCTIGTNTVWAALCSDIIIEFYRIWYGWTAGCIRQRLSVLLNYVHTLCDCHDHFSFYKPGKKEKNVWFWKGNHTYRFSLLNLVQQLDQLGKLQNQPCCLFQLCVLGTVNHTAAKPLQAACTRFSKLLFSPKPVARIFPNPTK